MDDLDVLINTWAEEQYLLLANADAGTWEVLRRDETGDVIVKTFKTHAWARKYCDRRNNPPSTAPATPKRLEPSLTPAERSVLDQRALAFAARHDLTLDPASSDAGAICAALFEALHDLDRWPSREEEMQRRKLVYKWTAVEQRLRARLARRGEI